MNNGNMSLAELEKVSDCLGEDIHSLLLKGIYDTYDKFISALYQDLENIVCRLEQNKKIRFADKEDRMTEAILCYLNGRGFEANHDTTYGSRHCDLVVRLNKFTWLGENKKHVDYDYLMKGFNQLTTRYATGTDFL